MPKSSNRSSKPRKQRPDNPAEPAMASDRGQRLSAKQSRSTPALRNTSKAAPEKGGEAKPRKMRLAQKRAQRTGTPRRADTRDKG